MATDYLDTNVVSDVGWDKAGDSVDPAVLELLRLHKRGVVDLKTSSLSKEEIENHEGEDRPHLLEAYELFKGVPHVETDKLVRINSCWGPHGGWNNPIIEQDEVFRKLQSLKDKRGDPTIKEKDAHHLMVAHHARCRVFITGDGGINGQKKFVEKHTCLLVRRPAEYLAEFVSESDRRGP